MVEVLRDVKRNRVLGFPAMNTATSAKSKKKPSLGARLLDKFLKKNATEGVAVWAVHHGFEHSYLQYLRRGARLPSFKMAKRLQTETKKSVPVQAWAEP